MKLFKKDISFEDVSYYSLLLFGFSFPLSKAAVSFFIFWFLLLALYKRDYKYSFKILKENKIFIYIALFIGFLYLSFFWTEDFKTAFGQLKMYGYWIIVPLIVIIAQKKWAPAILNAFLLGMFVSEILSYGMYFELWNLNNRGPAYPVPFMSHIHYSVFLAFTSLILLYRFLFKEGSFFYKIPFFIFFLLSTTNLMLSTGRTGQLAFFVTLFIVFIIRYKANIKTLFIAAVTLICIVIASYYAILNFQKRADMAISDVKKIVNSNYNSSFGIRVLFWKITYDTLKEKPLFGDGVGDFKLNSKEMIEKYKYEGMNKSTEKFVLNAHYHNQYLMILVQSGLIGFSLMILLFYNLFKLDIENKEIKNMSIIGFCVVLVSFIAEPLFILHFPTMLFLFIVSLSVVSSGKTE